MGLPHTVSEINGDFGRKSHFHTLCILSTLLTSSSRNFVTAVSLETTVMPYQAMEGV